MQSWGLTDPGCVRKQNQDSYRMEQLDRGNLLCIVCDGMGGAKSGNIASSLAVDVFVEEVRRCWKPVMEQDKVDQMLRSAVKLANFTVYDQSRQFEEFDGMGTTLVAVMVRGRKATVVNVGDSRAYHVGKSGIRQVTKDHSLVAEMVRLGEVDVAAAREHPDKNIITRAIGAKADVEADFFEVELQEGDRIVICTDGLTNMVEDEVIRNIVSCDISIEEKTELLVKTANQNGGRDNITVMIIEPFMYEVKAC